jgi:hypothetical protein
MADDSNKIVPTLRIESVPLEQAADALRSWSDNPSRFRKIMGNMD